MNKNILNRLLKLSNKHNGYLSVSDLNNALKGYTESEIKEIKEELVKVNVNIVDEYMDELISDDEITQEELENFDKLPQGIRVDDPVKIYLRDIGLYPLLSQAKEKEICTIIDKGLKAKKKLEENNDLSEEEKKELQDLIDKGKIAREQLISSNYRLVVSIAKKYASRGLDLLDLIQEGNMGLMKAIGKYDIAKGFKFSTYSTWWIRQQITRAVADQARTIRIPVHMVETINKYGRAKRELIQKLSREPSADEIAEYLNMDVEKIYNIQRISQEPISLEAPVGEEEDSSMGDFIADQNTLDPFQYSCEENKRQSVLEALSTLNEREAKVISMRYGFRDGKTHTLEEVGDIYQVTRERIRQIEAKAIRKLKNPSKTKKLKDFT